MKVIVISDLHLGAGDKRDIFYSDDSLCTFLKAHKDDYIILAGDITEMWDVKDVNDIYAGHPKVCSYISYYVDRLIRGNHDNHLIEFCGLPFEDEVVIGDTVIMHGHLFDFLNSGWRTFIGRALTPATKLLQKIVGREVKRRLRAYFERWGRHSTGDKYLNAARKYAKEKGYKRVVMGHTHKWETTIEPDFHYLNTGNWIHGRTGDYQEFETEEL